MAFYDKNDKPCKQQLSKINNNNNNKYAKSNLKKDYNHYN